MRKHEGDIGNGAGQPLLTVDGLATRLVISRKQVYKLVKRGEIPSVRVGERLVFARRRSTRISTVKRDHETRSGPPTPPLSTSQPSGRKIPATPERTATSRRRAAPPAATSARRRFTFAGTSSCSAAVSGCGGPRERA